MPIGAKETMKRELMPTGTQERYRELSFLCGDRVCNRSFFFKRSVSDDLKEKIVSAGEERLLS